ncbi:MAG: hypothetical protein ABIH34_03405 [Nanoarchaeota archaeon]
MKLLVHLAGEYLDFSAAEAVSALSLKNHKSDGRFLVGEGVVKKVLLGYSHALYEVLFSCSRGELMKKCEEFPWMKHYKTSFSVRSAEKERELADIIYLSLKKPKVDLKKAKTGFFFFFGKRVYACKLLYDMPAPLPSTTTWPEFHPASTSPRFARALVNLSGAKSIVDPFCGIGTIPIDAVMQGRKAAGFDIDPIMIKRAKKNARHFRKKILFEERDALLMRKTEALVSDLPFGKNARIVGGERDEFYARFFDRARESAKKAVIVVPQTGKDRFSQLVKKYWKIEQSFLIPVHRSLAKRVFLCSAR